MCHFLTLPYSISHTWASCPTRGYWLNWGPSSWISLEAEKEQSSDCCWTSQAWKPHTLTFIINLYSINLQFTKKILRKLLLKGQTNLLIADQLEATSEGKLPNWLWFATSSDNWGNFAVSKLARLIKLLLETSTMVNFVHWSTPGISRSPYKKKELIISSFFTRTKTKTHSLNDYHSCHGRTYNAQGHYWNALQTSNLFKERLRVVNWDNCEMVGTCEKLLPYQKWSKCQILGLWLRYQGFNWGAEEEKESKILFFLFVFFFICQCEHFSHNDPWYIQ